MYRPMPLRTTPFEISLTQTMLQEPEASQVTKERWLVNAKEFGYFVPAPHQRFLSLYVWQDVTTESDVVVCLGGGSHHAKGTLQN